MTATTFHLLRWTDGALLEPLLDPLAVHFEGAAAFEAWKTALMSGLMVGHHALMGVWAGEGLRGGLLLEGSRAHRTVLAVVGEVSESDLGGAMAALQAHTDAITYDADTGPAWIEALAPLGFRPFKRQTFVQDQARVAYRDVSEGAIALVPWEDIYRDEVVALLAEANAGTLDGLFLVLPDWPTPAACARVLDDLLAGRSGQFLPWASFVATEGDGLRGVVLAVESEPGRQALLFDLAVHPAARGQNLSRRLVHALQRALVAHGFRELLFMTMAENTPVQRLFRPEEIVRYEESQGGYWIRSASGPGP